MGDWLQESKNPIRCPLCGYLSNKEKALPVTELTVLLPGDRVVPAGLHSYQCLGVDRHIFFLPEEGKTWLKL